MFHLSETVYCKGCDNILLCTPHHALFHFIPWGYGYQENAKNLAKSPEQSKFPQQLVNFQRSAQHTHCQQQMSCVCPVPSVPST